MSFFRCAAILAILLCLRHLPACVAEEPVTQKRVAAIIASWNPNSHPDVILGRLIKTSTMDGKGEPSRLKLVSVFRDKPSEKDMTERLAAEYGFTVANSVAEALTLGTGTLAVDGVFIITEHGQYPLSATGRTLYQHRRLFEETVTVFAASHRVVPVFIDKHLADSWGDAKWIYDTAKRMKIPLMAGSSVPGTWRRPEADVRRSARLKEIVGISYHTLDSYGFHGMEMVQCLAERRQGGETGIVSVRCLTDQAVWDAAGTRYDPALLDAAVGRLERKLPAGKTLRDVVRHPILFTMQYRDGLRVHLFTLNGFASQWSAAWRYRKDNAVESTLFWTHERAPIMHFAYLVQGIEQMIYTGKATWPVERTLLTSGALDALLQSQRENGRLIKTPQLGIRYRSAWNWLQPPDIGLQ